MTGSYFGTIAQLLYAEGQPLNFVRLVEDLHRSLSRLDETGLPLRWEGADLAYFDLSAVRIVLGVADYPASGHSACLTIAVGPSAGGSLPAASAGFEQTCQSLVDHLQRSYPALTILWHQADEPLTKSEHDRLVAALPMLTHPRTDPEQDAVSGPGTSDAVCHAADAGAPRSESSEPFKRPLLTRKANPADRVSRKSLARSGTANVRAVKARGRGRTHFTAPAIGGLPVTTTGSDGSAHPATFDLEFARVRGAFNQIDEDPPAPHLSTPLRLTTHALNASLVLVWPPLGAAVIAHSLFRGENARFSGYIVVLTGLFGVALDTGVGQYMAAMAGV